VEASDRDWLATLADAYGVRPDLSAVGSAIYRRLREPESWTISIETLHDAPAEWQAILQILGQLATRPADFGRIRRGKRPAGMSWKALVTMVSMYPIARPADDFIDEVIAEIVGTLPERA
jgi:hypothetical protein